MDSFSRPACHLRSSSLPSKNHPLAASVEEQLVRLRASGSLCQKLGGLKDLYERVDDLFQLPLIQQALSHEYQDKCVDDLLDGSLRLLDVCSTTRDVFSQMKECIQELESSLRRKRTVESSLENEVKAYMTSRKRLNKVISKCFGNLKRMEKNATALPSEKKSDLTAAVSMLKEVEEISIVVLESLLSFVSPPKTRTRSTGWNAVTKLFQSGRVSCEDANEVEKMDAELIVLIGRKFSLVNMQNALKGLEALESSIQEMEEELECVYRRLLKSRVSLLNMLNH
ncbi:uncharacterized protein LOC8267882 [Ricinus communis]|uniref:uncharacterized protein LOC8267882 n=1 Tax=Ricinus communis TaxID=3988 RepID=UPI00201B24E4|nr:uncharacterized protein LOC8267882 [Ricinus communis]